MYAFAHLLGGESSAWLTPTAGEKYFLWVRVGQLSLCSQALLLPLGVPSHAGTGMLIFPGRTCNTGPGGLSAVPAVSPNSGEVLEAPALCVSTVGRTELGR